MLPYDERGSGDPVVLIHAGVADRSMWREHVEWLGEAGFRAIAIDLPGFGEAAVDEGGEAPWESVLSTLRELGVSEATLVGNSFGAAVALRVAAVAPAAVRSLVLVSPPPLDLEPSPVLAAAWEAEEAALERGDVDAAVAAVVEAWVRRDAPEHLRQRVATMQRRAFELQLASPTPEEAPDPLEGGTDELQRLHMPVLLAAGEADMPDFQQGAEQLARLLPQSRLVLLKGAAHLAPLEAPDEFRDLLLEFLRGLD